MQSAGVSRIHMRDFERLIIAWKTDSNGDCVYDIPDDIDGVLHRLEGRHEESGLIGSTYDVRLRDAFGADVLMGLGEGLAYAAAEAHVITMSDLHLPVPVMRRHTLEVDTGAEATSGLLELLVCRDLARRLIE